MHDHLILPLDEHFSFRTIEEFKYQLHVETNKCKGTSNFIMSLISHQYRDAHSRRVVETEVTEMLVSIHFIEFIDFQTNLYKLQNSFW